MIEEARRHADYALVGLALRVHVDGDTVTDSALAFFGVAGTPVRATAAEAALNNEPATAETFAEVAAIVADELDPPADIHGSTPYRKHLAATLTRRGLARATATIGAPA